MKKRLAIAGGLGIIAGFLGGCMYHLAVVATEIALKAAKSKSVLTNFIEKKILKD